MFSGSGSIGKTMTAEILVNHLKIDLYRIDLSAVVSKYIGETEKNLRRVLDAAEQADTILFFDDADALFGKRSELKDSHDCCSNNYLIQWVEDYRRLASRLEISGGNIKGIALYAVILTADGEMSVEFGDSKTGECPPTDRDNVVAKYRCRGEVQDRDLVISAVRMYVNGVLCELHPIVKIPIVIIRRQYHPKHRHVVATVVRVSEFRINDEAFKKGQWVIISTNKTPKCMVTKIIGISPRRNTLKLNGDVLAFTGGLKHAYLQRMISHSQRPFSRHGTWESPRGKTDLVFLDVWEQPVTAIDDNELVEITLGVSETATRIRTISQVDIPPPIQALFQVLYEDMEWIVQGEGGISSSDVLRARERVTITGMGSNFRGAYYITQITHSITDSGYSQSFNIKRNT